MSQPTITTASSTGERFYDRMGEAAHTESHPKSGYNLTSLSQTATKNAFVITGGSLGCQDGFAVEWIVITEVRYNEPVHSEPIDNPIIITEVRYNRRFVRTSGRVRYGVLRYNEDTL